LAQDHLRARLRTLLIAGTAGLIPSMAIIASAPMPQAHAAASNNSSFRLSSFTVNGNQQVPTDAITSALPYHVGDVLTRNQINAGLQKVVDVYQQKNVGANFKTRMKFLNKTVAVELDITEQAPGAPGATQVQALLLDKLVFDGNRKPSAADLTTASGLTVGQTLTSEQVNAATQKISDYYKKIGISAQIQPSADYPNKDNHVVLTYKITEQH
jgi:outer membrane protein assembly factor BamA